MRVPLESWWAGPCWDVHVAMVLCLNIRKLRLWGREQQCLVCMGPFTMSCNGRSRACVPCWHSGWELECLEGDGRSDSRSGGRDVFAAFCRALQWGSFPLSVRRAFEARRWRHERIDTYKIAEAEPCRVSDPAAPQILLHNPGVTSRHGAALGIPHMRKWLGRGDCPSRQTWWLPWCILWLFSLVASGIFFLWTCGFIFPKNPTAKSLGVWVQHSMEDVLGSLWGVWFCACSWWLGPVYICPQSNHSNTTAQHQELKPLAKNYHNRVMRYGGQSSHSISWGDVQECPGCHRRGVQARMAVPGPSTATHWGWLGHRATTSVGAHEALQGFSHPLSAFWNVQKSLASLMKPTLLQTGRVLPISVHFLLSCVLVMMGIFHMLIFFLPLG